MDTSAFAAITAGKYVSLTTFRKDGTPVATPVWFALDGETVVVQTPAHTGKLKRLRRDPAVELARCDVRGRIRPGEPVATGTASIVADRSDAERLLGLLRERYGLVYRLANAVIGGRPGEPDVLLRIELG
ncbi:PPOX class F420-dependent oxidoreductase [Agromyces seonyuensis]|uniref:PPOX class F420-dependent oxidoreductase n=1 Tax=Agromyces seonyuensis TaxID=2662446 RepID=A0A6I4P2W8_9MICO|nr:PPOX class F420-dependent oxidoreductase [Agromyces seonyuensis]